MPDTAVARLSTLLDKTATDPDQEPSERLSSLRMLRDDLSTLLGQADQYIADQQGIREGAAMSRFGDFMSARENAMVRGNMLASGMATPEQMDGGGYLSDEQLDARAADGTIEESIFGLEQRIEDAQVRMVRDYTLTEASGSGPSQPSTADVYGRMVDGHRVYDKSRRDLHKTIIKSFLQGHVNSGTKQPLDVDPDAIKSFLPEYATMRANDDDGADDAVDEEANDIAGGLQKSAAENKIATTVTGEGEADDGDDDGDPGLQYGDLPDVSFDPNQDWRVSQLQYMRGQYGDFAPDEFGEFGDVDEAVWDEEKHPRSHGKFAAALGDAARDGGGTIDAASGRSVHHGYAVAVPNHSAIIPEDEFAKDPAGHIENWLTEHKDAFTDGVHVGIWHDHEAGTVVLDPSEVMEDRDMAIKAGVDRDQKAIYHLDTDQEIPTGGSGENHVEEARRDDQAEQAGERDDAGGDQAVVEGDGGDDHPGDVDEPEHERLAGASSPEGDDDE